MDRLSQWFDTDFWRSAVLFIETMAMKSLQVAGVLLMAFWFSRLLQRIAEHRLKQDNQNERCDLIM
jgi:hypothetical protein